MLLARVVLPRQRRPSYDLNRRIRETEAYRPFPDRKGRNARQVALELPLLVRSLGLPEHSRVLEVGCGRGVALPPLFWLCRPALLVGLDIDGTALATAKRTLTAHSVPALLIQGDVRALPFEDRAFDVVVDFGTCFHISRAAEALREIGRVLRRGGVLAAETRVSQLLSHPIRALGRKLPWGAVPELRLARHRLLWASHRKC